MATESLLSDNDIETGSWFVIEGDKAEVKYGLDLLQRCPGNAILYYKLGTDRIVSTPPTKAELIKGEVIIGWCNSVRGQDTADREEGREESEAIRQRRIREEDVAAVKLGYTSHHDLLEQTGSGIVLDVEPANSANLSPGGIALPPGTSVPSAVEETVTTPPRTVRGDSATDTIVERLQDELERAQVDHQGLVDQASFIKEEMEALSAAIAALT